MYYRDVSRHWLEFYCKNTNIKHYIKEKAKVNWNICKEILNDYSDYKDFIFAFYTHENRMKTIEKYSFEMGVENNHLWHIINDLERDFANKKGI